MPDIVWTDVTALQASLSGVGAAAQTEILDFVNGALNAASFGGDTSKRYRLARICLAAHLGELARRDGQETVSSESIGPGGISLSYASSDKAALAQTAWGRQFEALIKLSHLRIGVL